MISFKGANETPTVPIVYANTSIRDKSYNPPHVSEARDKEDYEVIDGRLGWSKDPLPEAGGAKNPLKRGVAAGSANGFKAIKQAKISPIDQAIASIEQGRLNLETERLEWDKARVAEDMAFRKQKEANRHQEVLLIEENRARDSLAMVQLQMAKIENDRRRIDMEMALLEERRK